MKIDHIYICLLVDIIQKAYYQSHLEHFLDKKKDLLSGPLALCRLMHISFVGLHNDWEEHFNGTVVSGDYLSYQSRPDLFILVLISNWLCYDRKNLNIQPCAKFLFSIFNIMRLRFFREYKNNVATYFDMSANYDFYTHSLLPSYILRSSLTTFYCTKSSFFIPSFKVLVRFVYFSNFSSYLEIIMDIYSDRI